MCIDSTGTTCTVDLVLLVQKYTHHTCGVYEVLKKTILMGSSYAHIFFIIIYAGRRPTNNKFHYGYL